MAKHEYERPWQVMPAKIIKLALEHAEKGNDFDHQVAYLLLDIGVEAALKVYLVNKKQDVERIVFPDLLKRVKDELAKSGSNLVQEIEDVGYFHGIRNKLYHQGDGVKPTEDNLKRYSALARKIIEEIIEVNLQTEEKKYVVSIDGEKHEFEQLVDAIDAKLEYFQETCAIIIEKHRPTYGTREFAMKLKFILKNWPDREEDDPEDRIENRKYRLDKFNELTGKNLTNHRFLDYLLEDVNHLYVYIALQQISENLSDEWKIYVDLDERRSRLLSDWKSSVHREPKTTDQVFAEFEKLNSWIDTQQNKADQWIDSHFENIYKGRPPFTCLDSQLI